MQMLYLKALDGMIRMADELGKSEKDYRAQFQRVCENMNLFWDEEKGAFVDSFCSGRRHITRQNNVFAILFGFANEAQTDSIAQRVLLNDDIAPVTNGFFQSLQIEALFIAGRYKEASEFLKGFWGGMLEAGTSTFWERYDKTKTGAERYAMYGHPFGCGQCTGWGATPIYLLSKCFLGVFPTEPGFHRFTVSPALCDCEWIKGIVPTPRGNISVEVSASTVTVYTELSGGTLQVGDERIAITPGQKITVPIVAGEKRICKKIGQDTAEYG